MSMEHPLPKIDLQSCSSLCCVYLPIDLHGVVMNSGKKTKKTLIPQSLPAFVTKFEIHCDWIRAPLSHLRIGAL